MKILLIVVAALAVFVAFAALATIRQKRNDNRFLEWLRGQADTIILKNVDLVHEHIRTHDHHHSTQHKCRELLVGSTFVMLHTGAPAALYNTALSPKGVSGITDDVPLTVEGLSRWWE